MVGTADKQVCAHAQCSGGGEGAASTPLDAQGLGPLALQISESAFSSSISMAQGKMGLAPFPHGCQHEGTFSIPLSTSGREEGLIQHRFSPTNFGDEKTRGLPSWHGGSSGVQM